MLHAVEEDRRYTQHIVCVAKYIFIFIAVVVGCWMLYSDGDGVASFVLSCRFSWQIHKQEEMKRLKTMNQGFRLRQ